MHAPIAPLGKLLVVAILDSRNAEHVSPERRSGENTGARVEDRTGTGRFFRPANSVPWRVSVAHAVIYSTCRLPWFCTLRSQTAWPFTCACRGQGGLVPEVADNYSASLIHNTQKHRRLSRPPCSSL
jgi:hypothetical protein